MEVAEIKKTDRSGVKKNHEVNLFHYYNGSVHYYKSHKVFC